MPIVSADIKYYLSGGGANTDPNASLGGVISTTEVTTATLHNLFDVVSGDESTAGDTEYRCFYVKNTHATLTLQSPVVWIQTQTPSPDTSAEIALDANGANATAVTVADENTAPSGASFSAPSSKGAGLSLGNLAPGQKYGIWVKRIVPAATAAYNTDGVVIRVEGDTSA
jgi:hypothetical protein